MQRCVINCNLINRTSVCHIQQQQRLILGKICWWVFEIWFFWAKNEWRIGFIYIFVGAHVLICSKAKLTSVQKGWFLAENMIWWNNISSMPIFGEGGDKIFKKPGLVLFASKLQPFRCTGPFLSPTNTSQSNCADFFQSFEWRGYWITTIVCFDQSLYLFWDNQRIIIVI